uniref:Uncharacterized protein n=1 Tax=Anguilla anguilla TaxID=7936 RepID=A0A0E9W9D5_ANGAN
MVTTFKSVHAFAQKCASHHWLMLVSSKGDRNEQTEQTTSWAV